MSDGLAKARAAMLAELSRPRVKWTTYALRASVALVALFILTATGLGLAGPATVELATAHAAAAAVLVAAAALSVWAAVAPVDSRRRRSALLAVAGLAGVVVLLRGEGAASTAAPWVCTVSHLGVGLLPAAVMVLVLRHQAPNSTRSLVAGLAAGTVGAFAGELACGQSATHVALFHLPAWALVAVAVSVISSKVTPRSFAP